MSNKKSVIGNFYFKDRFIYAKFVRNSVESKLLKKSSGTFSIPQISHKVLEILCNLGIDFLNLVDSVELNGLS